MPQQNNDPHHDAIAPGSAPAPLKRWNNPTTPRKRPERRYELRCRSHRYFVGGKRYVVRYYCLVVYRRNKENSSWIMQKTVRLGRSPTITTQMAHQEQLRLDLLAYVPGLKIIHHEEKDANNARDR